ncbi:unnamed protein product [Prorocentrum cordatum]|uniref:non-specific serine/threonine protein kinase n=1 Tax=Prorocentrum cordatum TaxID=2364126 RepID=A0ABN9QW39_9DINO|nr:unnamed protein product [Polarella glacialis]
MGENLLALVKHHDYNGLPLPLVRRLSRHTLSGLEYIHSRGVIHTDVKLENVLVQRHDFAELLCEARRAHRAFMEQKKGTVDLLSKAQKKRMKKKEKKTAGKAPEAAAAAAADEADDKGEADQEDKGGDADEAAAEACGRPVPPVRQRERFDTLDFCQVNAKLADFGNGVFSNRKVTDDIQTRQYRSPEVIIGTAWDETADVWSAACMIFELATGDFLFDPHADDGWSRDEDHLALMTELLGDLPPREWALSGKYSKEFFNNSGKLKHIKSLKYWALIDVLKEKYSMSQDRGRGRDLGLPDADADLGAQSEAHGERSAEAPLGAARARRRPGRCRAGDAAP